MNLSPTLISGSFSRDVGTLDDGSNGSDPLVVFSHFFQSIIPDMPSVFRISRLFLIFEHRRRINIADHLAYSNAL